MTTGLVSNFYFLWVPHEVVFKGGVISNITNYDLLNCIWRTVLLLVFYCLSYKEDLGIR